MRDGVSNKSDTGDDSNVESGVATSASRHVMADASLGRCSRRKPAAPWRSRPPQAGADDADVDWPLGDTASRLQAGLPDAFDLSAPSTSSSSAPATPVGGLFSGVRQREGHCSRLRQSLALTSVQFS
ncbi:uncharacterized protein LOC126426609 [Schistocerca serialis cubense]|uniref:uncharacterized protein LOC126426609 n=1 Tax=Schistocerca serialis cubense TaxID=2023355 RepID=UPI00214DF9A6|nr:uncharacterized protein LOC126426609 [Schistocerca serialis cubense]